MDYLQMFEKSLIETNSMFKLFEKPQEVVSKVKDIIKQLENHTIPVRYDSEIINNFNTLILRQEISKIQGFVLLTQEWIDDFAEWIGNRKCLEIMCGCGSLSKALKDKGIDVIATDNFSWGDGEVSWNKAKNYWTDIENIDCIEAIEKYKDRDIVIMSWAYMDDTAYRSLLKMREVNPNMVMIVIGEGEGGCTASEDFFDALEEIDSEEIDNINSKIPRWRGIHDYMRLVK